MCSSLCYANLLGIPTVPFTSTSDGVFDVYSARSITVDSRYCSSRDREGWTLIPPTLEEFANTFAEDLRSIGDCHALVRRGSSCEQQDIFLTLGDSDKFLDVAGSPTSEGYRLDVTESGVTVIGASPLGVWWGTRTVLQQAILNNGRIAVGNGRDAPGWGTRGIMVRSCISTLRMRLFHLLTCLLKARWRPPLLSTFVRR